MSTPRIRCSAIILRSDQVLLIHRLKEHAEYYSFPGGGLEVGETTQAAVIREVKEETSLDVTKILEESQYFDSVKNNDNYFLVCEVGPGLPKLGGPEPQKHSPDNQYCPEWVSVSKAISLNNLYPAPMKHYLQQLYENVQKSH